MNKFLFVFLGALCLFSVLLISGCEKVPDGFPRTIPCTVTITDEGKPVDGVFIQIDTVPPTSSLSITAKADANGQAMMQTYLGAYGRSGVPTGNLVLSLQKEPVAEHFKSDEERAKMTYDEGMKYGKELKARSDKLPKIVPEALMNSKTSPLKMEAKAGSSIQWNVKLEEYRK